jgi:uncharacterized membrane protein YhaH (DUF805 family)
MKLFEGRLNRRSCITGLIIFWILEFVATIPTYIITYSQHLNEFGDLSKLEATKLLASQFSLFSTGGIIFYILTIAVLFLSLGVCVRRLHDLGKPGTLAILVIIDFFVKRGFAEWVLFSGFNASISTIWIIQVPNIFSAIVGIFVLYLMIQKGEDTPNKYGEVTLDKSGLKNILLAK